MKKNLYPILKKLDFSGLLDKMLFKIEVNFSMYLIITISFFMTKS